MRRKSTKCQPTGQIIQDPPAIGKLIIHLLHTVPCFLQRAHRGRHRCFLVSLVLPSSFIILDGLLVLVAQALELLVPVDIALCDLLISESLQVDSGVGEHSGGIERGL